MIDLQALGRNTKHWLHWFGSFQNLSLPKNNHLEYFTKVLSQLNLIQRNFFVRLLLEKNLATLVSN